MPEQLLGRIIRTCSESGELVLDPFSGSATTLAVAKKLGRQQIGFDLSKEYVAHGRKRLDSIEVGDPLDGSPEPTKGGKQSTSAKTVDGPSRKGKSGKRRSLSAKQADGGDSQPSKQQSLGTKLT